jgi:hypothetical protein
MLSLKLQSQIVQTLCRLLARGNRDLLHILCDCGLVRSASLFLQCAFDTIRDVPKLGILSAFSKEYRAFTATIKSLVLTLVSASDKKVAEDIIDLGILQRVAEEWLPSTAQLALQQSSIDTDHNPLAVRCLALRLIRIVLSHRTADSDDRLTAELCRWIVSSGAVTRELNLLRSQSTKKGSANSRKTAAEVLPMMASIGAEAIDQEMKVNHCY